MSYAKNSRATDESQRVADYNHFVIFDPRVRNPLKSIGEKTCVY